MSSPIGRFRKATASALFVPTLKGPTPNVPAYIHSSFDRLRTNGFRHLQGTHAQDERVPATPGQTLSGRTDAHLRSLSGSLVRPDKRNRLRPDDPNRPVCPKPSGSAGLQPAPIRHRRRSGARPTILAWQHCLSSPDRARHSPTYLQISTALAVTVRAYPQTWRKTRKWLRPSILRRSSSFQPRASKPSVICGTTVASFSTSPPPSKSDPRPMQSVPPT